MTRTDRRVDIYISKQTSWRAELHAVRAVLLSTQLTETFKWRAPCYTSDGTNICNIGPLKSGCALGFFAGELLSDPDGLLHPVGPNSRSAKRAMFTSVEAVKEADATIHALVAEAIAKAAAGAKIDFTQSDLPPPDELTQALYADPALAEAFAALTPGRKRGYYLHIGAAKQSTTRSARIQKCRDRIFAGKGFNER